MVSYTTRVVVKDILNLRLEEIGVFMLLKDMGYCNWNIALFVDGGSRLSIREIGMG